MAATPPDDFWAPRRCMLAPVPEIALAARLLSQAVDAHLAGDHAKASHLIAEADMPSIRAWTEALWGPKTESVHRLRAIASSLPLLPMAQRIPLRMPTRAEMAALIARDGRTCRYCGIPLITADVRKRMKAVYPEVRWGRKNAEQHAAFQAMWLTYDHVIPHSYGGTNTLDNMIIACQPCNCAKMETSLEEFGLIDPRSIPPQPSTWDGLERFA